MLSNVLRSPLKLTSLDPLEAENINGCCSSCWRFKGQDDSDRILEHWFTVSFCSRSISHWSHPWLIVCRLSESHWRDRRPEMSTLTILYRVERGIARKRHINQHPLNRGSQFGGYHRETPVNMQRRETDIPVTNQRRGKNLWLHMVSTRFTVFLNICLVWLLWMEK